MSQLLKISKKSKGLFSGLLILGLAYVAPAMSQERPPEISCTIRDSGQNLNCIWVGKESKKTMTAEDVASFVDHSAVMAYITVRSRKGMERTYQPDSNSAQFKKLNELKKLGSITEISKAKTDLWTDLEKTVIKLSDDLDAQALTATLVKFDASITGDRFKRELRDNTKELEGFRANRDKVCTATPQFEAMSKTNKSLQTALSNVLVAFQTPGTCMSGFKVFQDKDGTVDLRQLEGVGKTFVDQCKK
jgi:hypothetical protein